MSTDSDPQPASAVSFAATPSSKRWQVIIKSFLALLLVACVARIVVKATPEAFKRSSDFRAVYLSTRAMIKGVNPYDHTELDKVYLEAGGVSADGPIWHMTPSVYPPIPFTLMTPLALMPHYYAVRLLFVINLFCLGVIWWVLVRWSGLPFGDWRAMLLAVFIFSLGPVVTSLKLGQPGIMAVTATILSLWLASCNKKQWLPGLLLGIAIVLKPQIGGVFFIYYVCRRRWKLCIASAIIPALCAGVALVRLQTTDPAWLASFMANLKTVESGAGAQVGFNNPTLANPDRYEMIDLPILLHGFYSSRPIVAALTYGITICLALAFAVRLKRTNTPAAGLLPASVVAVITLLPVYHRYYDAILLVMVAACAVALLRSDTWRWALALLALLAPFIISWTFILDNWRKSHKLPADISESWAWDTIIMPHQVWTLLLLVLLLLWMIRRPPLLRA